MSTDKLAAEGTKYRVWELTVDEDGELEVTQHRTEAAAWGTLLGDARAQRDLREWLDLDADDLIGRPAALTGEEMQAILEALASAGTDVVVGSYIFDTEGYERI